MKPRLGLWMKPMHLNKPYFLSSETVTQQKNEKFKEILKIRQEVADMSRDELQLYHKGPLTTPVNFADERYDLIRYRRNHYLVFRFLKGIALLFLAPLLSITVYFLLLQSGIQNEPTTIKGQIGIYILAVVIFTVGLVTNQVVLTLISFTKGLLRGINKGEDHKDEDQDDYQEIKQMNLELQLDTDVVNAGGTIIITSRVQTIDSKSPIPGAKLSGNVLTPSKHEYKKLEPNYTDNEGKTIHQLKIEEISEFGLYIVTLEATIEGYKRIESSRTFNVKKENIP